LHPPFPGVCIDLDLCVRDQGRAGSLGFTNLLKAAGIEESYAEAKDT